MSNLYSHWGVTLDYDDNEKWDQLCQSLTEASVDGFEVIDIIKTTRADYPGQYNVRFLLRKEL